MPNQIEMIVITKSKAQRALFQMQFMQMMLMAGREEAAEEALEKCTALLNEMIAEGN
jgi:hypothetical protein